MTVWRPENEPQRLRDPTDASSPSATTPSDAQNSVNFVVFDFGWLPDDCHVSAVTKRPELPPGRPDEMTAEDINQTPHSDGNPCTLRIVVDGNDRRFRLKEFLYDWAPPSASIAPLWRTTQPQPFNCGQTIGWLGTDYNDRRGGCVQRDRTQLELSVIDGEFSDTELESILNGLTRAAPEIATDIHRTPFHQLNYWVRYRCDPPRVPHGLYDYVPAHPYDQSRPLSPVALCTDSLVPPLIPSDSQFVLDSAISFAGAEAVEYIFRHRQNGSDHLWITATSEDSPLSPSLPLNPSDQSAQIRRSIELRGKTVQYAALTEEYGAWEALWAENGVCYSVWASSSQHLDDEEFKGIIDSLDTP